MLRLRVLHLDYTPSGAGADSVSTVGSAHEAFLAMLDGRLMRLLGRTAAGRVAPELVARPEEAHRLSSGGVPLVGSRQHVVVCELCFQLYSAEKKLRDTVDELAAVSGVDHSEQLVSVLRDGGESSPERHQSHQQH